MADEIKWGWEDARRVLRALHWQELQVQLRLRQEARNRLLDADTTNIISRSGLTERGGFGE